MRYVLVLLLLTACGAPRPTEPSDKAVLAEVYKARHLMAVWPLGPSQTDCDAALWAGIAARADVDVRLSAYLTADGRTTRRPFADCNSPDSASQTSNDMITGLILGFYAQENLAALESMWSYGERNDWIMGEGLKSRTYLRPNGQSILARAIYALGGADHDQRHIPMVYSPGTEDYESHLRTLSYLARRDMGEPSPIHDTIVCLDMDPADALQLAVCGQKEAAAALLMNSYVSPSYVRGHENYHDAHWLLAAKVTLE